MEQEITWRGQRTDGLKLKRNQTIWEKDFTKQLVRSAKAHVGANAKHIYRVLNSAIGLWCFSKRKERTFRHLNRKLPHSLLSLYLTLEADRLTQALPVFTYNLTILLILLSMLRSPTVAQLSAYLLGKHHSLRGAVAAKSQQLYPRWPEEQQSQSSMCTSKHAAQARGEPVHGPVGWTAGNIKSSWVSLCVGGQIRRLL